MKKVIFLLLFFLPISIFGQSFYGFSESETDTVGIYYKNVDGKLQKISPIRASKTKSNSLASAFTYGIASTRMKSVFRGAASKNVLNKDSKVYFYFGDIPIKEAMTMYIFASQYSVYDFSICEFKTTKKTRTLETGKINIWSGSEFGTTETEKVKFRVEPIRKGVYECTIEETNGIGEFCFLFANTGVGAFGCVFDFSIVE